MSDDSVPERGEPDAAAAARDGYVAGMLFARRYPAQDPRVLLRVLLPWPLPRSECDFFDGFLTGAEAELGQQEDRQSFRVEWKSDPDVAWGETEWVLGPQPGHGPWRARRA